MKQAFCKKMSYSIIIIIVIILIGTIGWGQQRSSDNFVSGRFGKGFLSKEKGEMVLLPTAKHLNPKQGTIELWIRHSLPAKQRPEWGAVITAQTKPYPDPKKLTPGSLHGFIVQFTRHFKTLFLLLEVLEIKKET